jgi:hypothetical protein
VVDVETGETLASADGTYVAADEARKRELRARYVLGPPTADAAPPEGAP